MDVCPVGAITTRDYRFKSRPWDNPNAADTICTQCEKGCNITAWIKAKPEWAKGSRLIRFTPRFNPDVNGYWMCDIGRFEYHWIEGDDRLRKPLVREEVGQQQPASWHDLHAKLADRLQACTGLTRSDPVAVFDLRARVARGNVSRSAAGRGLHGPRDRSHRVELALRREITAASREIQGAAGGRPNVNGARLLGLVDGGVGDETRTADVTALRAGRGGRTRGALYVLDPGRKGRSATRSGCRRARQRRAAAAHRAGRPADAAGPRRRFRAAGRIVRREGSVLYQRSGSTAGDGAGHSSTRRRNGGLADPRQSCAIRWAWRSTTPRRRTCVPTSRPATPLSKAWPGYRP
jgi:hypothetical protein